MRLSCLVLLLYVQRASPSLPPSAVIHGLAISQSGTVYAAGTIGQSGFIAQLPDGYVYRSNAPLYALAVAADNSVFATGTDKSAFVIKLDPAGMLQYQRFVDGPASVGFAIAVNSAGEALISGYLSTQDPKLVATFPTTPGAVTLPNDYDNGFTVKFDALGQDALVSILGYGGGPAAFDTAGNILTTGILLFTDLIPTPGAMQPAQIRGGCGGSAFFSSPCGNEYVAKVSADGTKLLYSTYLTGSYGSNPTALLVDKAGNAIVTGTTPSHDFPVTPGAFQTKNRATDGPSSIYGYAGGRPPVIPPPTAGVISKINPDGTALLWSTYFGGTGNETISAAQIDSEGNIVFTGLTGSPDLPGATPPPLGCAPSYLRRRPYVAKLSADASSLLGASYVDLPPLSTPAIALTSNGSILLSVGESPSTVTIPSQQPAVCIVDAADIISVQRIAPNQLLTIFTNLGTTTPQVSFNGIPADILYSGPYQMNVRVPAEVTDPVIETTFNTPSGPVSRTFTLAPSAPSVFVQLKPATFYCSSESYPFAILTIARNADGTENSCAQPALSGSVATVFLNGLGTVVSPKITLRDPAPYATILSIDPDPNNLGVWKVQIKIQLPDIVLYAQPYKITLALLVNGEPVRDELTIRASQ